MRAAAEHIRPVVLELGGKSPSIVLADADLDVAADEIAKGIYRNTGQFCNASSRVVVDRSTKDELLDRIVARTRKLTVGPGAQDPDVGPLISIRQLDRVLGYIDAGRDEGARVVLGGGRADGFERGYFVAPTILDRVDPDARVAQEEIFGPVVTIHPVASESEALAVANNVAYGLAAGIFTRDIDRALRLATQVQAGQIYINEYFAGGEETPFGGYKQSGFGREKGLEALRNYTQVKNIAIRLRGRL
jgi:aldehyde dehydrogenase (NAD+)